MGRPIRATGDNSARKESALFVMLRRSVAPLLVIGLPFDSTDWTVYSRKVLSS